MLSKLVNLAVRICSLDYNHTDLMMTHPLSTDPDWSDALWTDPHWIDQIWTNPIWNGLTTDDFSSLTAAGDKNNFHPLELNRSELTRSETNWSELIWSEFNRSELNQSELNQSELNWSELNQSEMNLLNCRHAHIMIQSLNELDSLTAKISSLSTHLLGEYLHQVIVSTSFIKSL